MTHINIIKNVLGCCVVFFALSRSGFSDEIKKGDLKEIPNLPNKISKMKVEALKIETLDINTIKLKEIDVGNLGVKKIKNELESTKILRTGHSKGVFEKLESGDYQHLIISSNGERLSFWCINGCEKLEEKQVKAGTNLFVNWQEVEKFVPEANEKIRKKETVSISILKETPKKFKCTLYQKFPHLMEGCEGEACGFLKYEKAIKSAPIFEKTDKKSKNLGTINRCQKIKEFKTFTLLNEMGEVLVVKANKKLTQLGVQDGDIIPFISSLGEGFLKGCVDNTAIDMAMTGSDVREEALVEILTDPKTEGWIKVKSETGIEGYIPKSERFYMGYYDFSAENFCPEDHPCGATFLSKLKEIEKPLGSAFTAHCQNDENLNLEDPSKEHPIDIKVWNDIQKLFPTGVQCAAFYSSDKSCHNEWSGGVSCSCKRKPNETEFNLHYSFSCTKNTEKTNCTFDIL